jgi:hypothetical protein
MRDRVCGVSGHHGSTKRLHSHWRLFALILWIQNLAKAEVRLPMNILNATADQTTPLGCAEFFFEIIFVRL